jgi:hypothetical protein
MRASRENGRLLDDRFLWRRTGEPGEKSFSADNVVPPHRGLYPVGKVTHEETPPSRYAHTYCYTSNRSS